MSRVLGVDLGSRRIGLALSDPDGRVATPHAVIERSGDSDADHRTILARAREAGASRVVVGLPLSLSGDVGPAARGVLGEVDSLRALAAGEVTVETHDERLTTVIAERGMRAARASRSARRRKVDASAAAVMLQSYLEGRRA
jgi:putative Holliday junction resolvase